VTDIPRAVYNTGYNWLGSDRYVQDGTFLRLRSITARYTFNKLFVAKFGMKSLTTYLTAENLLTFTKYTGQDPEVPSRLSGVFSQAIDNSSTPPLMQFTLGLSASF